MTKIYIHILASRNYMYLYTCTHMGGVFYPTTVASLALSPRVSPIGYLFLTLFLVLHVPTLGFCFFWRLLFLTARRRDPIAGPWFVHHVPRGGCLAKRAKFRNRTNVQRGCTTANKDHEK